MLAIAEQMPAVSGERILVTGGTGFVGQNIVGRYIRAGVPVAILVRSTSKVPSAISDASTFVYDGGRADLVRMLKRFHPTVVIHAAAYFVAQHCADDTGPLVSANIAFGLELLDAMAEAGVKRLINFGTAWQHYNSQEYCPVSLYAATKQAFEDIAEFYVDSHGMTMVTLKLSDTYGPSDQRRKILPTLLKLKPSDAPMKMSPGFQLLDFVYIDDVVNAVITAVNSTKDRRKIHSRYALSSGSMISIRQLVTLIEELKSCSLPISWGTRPYRAREVMVPWQGIRLPNWLAHVSLPAGIKKLMEAQCSS